MTPARSERDPKIDPAPGPAKAKGKGRGSADRAADADGELARSEALELTARARRDLAALQSFVEDEEHAATRKAPSPKRLARLRLVGDDLASAVRLASTSSKG
jgi:hypothetical protein